MSAEQQKDLVQGLIYQYVAASNKLKSSETDQVKSKAAQKYLFQFDWLTFKKGYSIECI